MEAGLVAVTGVTLSQTQSFLHQHQPRPPAETHTTSAQLHTEAATATWRPTSKASFTRENNPTINFSVRASKRHSLPGHMTPQKSQVLIS